MFRPGRNSYPSSYPPIQPSPLRRSSCLPTPVDDQPEDFKAQSSHQLARTPGSVSYSSAPYSYGQAISSSPSLSQSMALSGLHLDVGMKDLSSWSCPPTLTYEYSTPSTVSPQSLHRPSSFATPNTYSFERPSMSPRRGSEGLGPHDMSYLPTPDPTFKHQVTSLDASSVWLSTEQSLYEPCDLALSEDDGRLDVASKWRPGQHWDVNKDTSCTPSDHSSVSPKIERVSSYDTPNPQSRAASNAPSMCAPVTQLDLQPKSAKRRLTQPEDVRHVCPICRKGFARTFNFNTHLQIHNPERKRPCPCDHPGCEKTFYRVTDLKRHISSVHVKSKEFQCHDCHARFPRKDSLQRHVTDGCIRRPAVEKRALKLKRQQQRRQRQWPAHARSGDIEDLHLGLQTDSEVDESEYTSNNDALRLLQASGEPAGAGEDHAYRD